LKRNWGLSIRETQFEALSLFLDEKLEASGLTWELYASVIEAGGPERADLLDAATVNETYFFRDGSQFELLRRRLLPAFRATHGRMPRLWSAACASGEEGLSLLLVLADVWGLGPESCRHQVWASDINPRALERFEAGSFRPASFRADGRQFHHLLDPFMTKDEAAVQISPALLALIPKREVNLITDSLASVPGTFDFIFLRNMMLYVPMGERPVIYRKIVDKLSPDGVLVLAKAEVPFFQDDEMELKEIDGNFVLTKKSSPAAPWKQGGLEWTART
jgi:chemotaxis protein methyltransferase CheR